ncbi:MAG: DUF1572 family protein [Saprospiraceae bacterium]|jgi:hypothetical protein|nr:DUF1572 family protein [Saprospiraceae bacterium]MBL0023861.1 DUF1572 family protein [Saprospiraceae bacterium]
MILNTMLSLFTRDLLKLKKEISAYQEEKNMWLTASDISNSGGNLCLHLIGNLNAYIGVGLANTSYIRQRDQEFSMKDIPRQELLLSIDATIQVVEIGLKHLDESRLNDHFPVLIWDEPKDNLYTLLHLLTHLNYHLGQINYHRRLLDQG